MTVQEKIEQLKAVKARLNEIATEAVYENLGVIIYEIQEQLQVRQVAGDGNAIGMYISDEYVRRKSQKTTSPFFSPPNVDLWGTGAWNRSITASADDGQYWIYENDSGITPFLMARYGSRILELDDYSRSNARKKLDPIVARYVLNEML